VGQLLEHLSLDGQCLLEGFLAALLAIGRRCVEALLGDLGDLANIEVCHLHPFTSRRSARLVGVSSSEQTDPEAPGADTDEEIRELARELRRRLEHCHQHRPQGRDPLSLETFADLLVLLTAFRTLWDNIGSEPPGPSRIDDYIEDMIDPEFGLQPSRRIIVQAAERILRGYEGLRFPRRRRAPGLSTDLDED